MTEHTVTNAGGSIRRDSISLSSGARLSYLTAGDPSRPALLLQHGFPNSSEMFRDIIPLLSSVAHVVAPDLPGFGESDVLPAPSFEAFGHTIAELLERLHIGDRYIYLHDFGAPSGLEIAMAEPDRVLGLIVQNANAHRSGLGPEWAPTIAYWTERTEENETAATAHLTLEGTRDQYVAGLPPEVADAIQGEPWEEDWRVMSLPGRLDTQRALIADYGSYVQRFDEVAAYLANRQPPALLLWGRHDTFFSIDETVSWMKALPRMEAHVLDGGHLLLETHSHRAAQLIHDFIRSRDRLS